MNKELQKVSFQSELDGREAMRALDMEHKEKAKQAREVDRREGAGYDVVALFRNIKGVDHLFLTLEPKDDAFDIVTELIELPPPTEKVPNRVKDALEHPMAYYAAAGIATEAFFSSQLSEAA